ncbi:type VII secretion target [Nocardia mexicana]|uniref:type VII secretion target n=1 Tax=Nocardia mexicana TaxID=279262 RepID=UPI001471DB4F|nr:type VII secretion target [Nocardia mexicana]
MIIEPDQLRQIAMQHERQAADIRKWGEIPQDYLDDYESSNGAIAGPFVESLRKYYDRRHRKAERLARNHERTRDNLLAAANALEESDDSGRRGVSRVGESGGLAPGDAPQHGPVDQPMPTGDGRHGPNGDRAQLGPQLTGMPTHLGGPGEFDRAGQGPVALGGAPPSTLPGAPDGAVAPGGAVPAGTTNPLSGAPESSSGALESGDADGLGSDTPVPASESSAAPAVGAALSDPVVGVPSPGMPPTGPVGDGEDVPPGPPGPLPPTPLPPGPFAAAAAPAGRRQSLPSLTVGAQVDQDLVLARTLLGAILAAVEDSFPDLGWGVGVLRAPIGPLVMVTSTEGRGWLPPGLFLPAEVFVPWRWDDRFGPAGREMMAPFESNPDPARTLAAFGLLADGLGLGRIAAVASSSAISDGVHAVLGNDAATEGNVRAAECTVDLSVPGVGLVDRLGMAGSDESLRRAVEVPESEIRTVCLELARVTDARVRSTTPAAGFTANHAGRQRVLDALYADLPVPSDWWEQAAPDMVESPESAHGTVFDRRAYEILLLLASGTPDRRILRDVLYAYDQIIEHPQFSATPEPAPVIGGSPISVGAVGRRETPPPIVELSRAIAGVGSPDERGRV